MELSRAQPKLFDTEHARGRKLQTEKIADSDSGHAGLSRSTKYVRHAPRETPKNATRTSAIYRVCFTKFMREMLRSLFKKGSKMY